MKITLFLILALMFTMFAFLPNGFAQDYTQWNLPGGATARLGKGSVNEIAYSPDGTQLAVAGSTGTWIYEAQTGTELDWLVEYASDPGRVQSVTYSPDGRTIASAGSHKVYLWDAATGQSRGLLEMPAIERVISDIHSVRYSPDGRILAAGGYADDAIRLWDTATGEQLATLQGHTEDITNVAFSPDGRTLASGSYDGTIRLWDVASRRHKQALRAHGKAVTSVTFTPDGKTLVSAGWDGTIRHWNAGTGQLKATFAEYWWSESISFSPDGRTFASANWDGKLRLWNAVTGQLKSTLDGHTIGVVSIVFHPDSRTFVSGSRDGQIRLWNAATGQLKSTLDGHTTEVSKIVYSPDGGTLVIGYYEAVRLWDANTEKLKSTLPTRSNWGDSLAYSPDGGTLAIANDKVVDFWDAGTGRKRATLTGHANWVRSVVYSPDGGTIASGDADGGLRLWDARSGTYRANLVGHTKGVDSISFSPDGRTLASGGYDDDVVRLWNANTRKMLKTFRGHPSGVVSVTFSPDGKTLAVENPGKQYFDAKIVLWDVETEKRKATLPIARSCYYSGVSFSPDGTLLAAGGNGGDLLLWDAATGEQLELFAGHGHWIESIAFSPDGATLASGSADGTVLLWDVAPFAPEQRQQDTDVQETQPDTEVQQAQPNTGIEEYEREMVRIIYFRPSDRSHREGIETELDTLIRWSQYFFAEQMQTYGKRKTFAFETDVNGHARVHHVTGKFTDTYYHQDTYRKVVEEVAEQFDTSRNVFLIAVDVSSEFINNEGTCGIGGGGWNSFNNELWRRDFGGAAVIPASGVCINPSVTAHELGHVFGLEHDFRNDTYLMAYGTQERLSECAAEWLDAHRFFNDDPTFFNEATTIDMRALNTSVPGTLRLQFEVKDADGLHQAHLLVPTATTDPAGGLKLHSCKSLNGENRTVEFVTTELTAASGKEVTLQIMDIHGGITKQAFPLVIEGGISNRSPVSTTTIPVQDLTVGGSSAVLNMSSYFSDPDGDVLSYTAESNNTNVTTISVSGTRMTIAPIGTGSATIAVTASDGKLRVVQHLSVRVKGTTIINASDNFDDPFEGTALQNSNWQWQNEPANWDIGKTRDGFLHIEGETNRNLWTSDASHFLYQETDADAFDVETHFFSRWDTSSGVNGLVVKSPADNNWVTIKFWSRDAWAKGQIQYQTRGQGLVADPAWRPEFGATELFLRLRKQGDTYTGWYKTREVDPWIEIGVTNFPLTPPLQLGIYAGVAAPSGTLTVDYDYFRSTVDTGILASPVLHVAAMETPAETTLLPNYPNPFNPETWIPYQLSSPSDVTVRIYAVNGSLIRHLPLGHQGAGLYHGRSRAAYWDGRNEIGEPVASGVYFYTLTAGDFTATRKMLIRK